MSLTYKYAAPINALFSNIAGSRDVEYKSVGTLANLGYELDEVIEINENFILRVFWVKESWLRRKRMRVVFKGDDKSCEVSIGSQKGYNDADDVIAKKIFGRIDEMFGSLTIK